ncbi:MAG: hypothetical protein HDQ98_15615 [Lachnospiraceae bacterium]|nr:hypothetical protein [Lachnospiraceae bacterium]
MELQEIRQLRFQEMISNKKNRMPQMEANCFKSYRCKVELKLLVQTGQDDIDYQIIAV